MDFQSLVLESIGSFMVFSPWIMHSFRNVDEGKFCIWCQILWVSWKRIFEASKWEFLQFYTVLNWLIEVLKCPIFPFFCRNIHARIITCIFVVVYIPHTSMIIFVYVHRIHMCCIFGEQNPLQYATYTISCIVLLFQEKKKKEKTENSFQIFVMSKLTSPYSMWVNFSITSLVHGCGFFPLLPLLLFSDGASRLDVFVAWYGNKTQM